MAEKWYNDLVILRDFAETLEDAGVIEDQRSVFKHPYRYQEQYEIWAEHGMPNFEDDNWETFVEALNFEEEQETEEEEE